MGDALAKPPRREIAPEWLARPATVVAPELIGCELVREWPDGQQVRSRIVETEAYEAATDPACHAYRGQTPRNAVMFGPAGWSYVYFIYGMYNCFNVVCDLPGVASAVLIRALQFEGVPMGLDPAIEQRLVQKKESLHRLAAGPGKLCRVLQIDRSLNGVPLQPGQPLWLAHRDPAWAAAWERGERSLVQTTRIGLTQGAELPWRWYLANCRSVSKL